MVPLHKVPNFALGKVAQRSVTRVFFPRKYVQDAQATITQSEFEVIYDECLRPAIERLLPESTARWPISYRAALELYRCRNDGESGRLAVATVELPWMILDQFSGSFLQLLADQNVVFRDAYFVHEVCGIKGASIHRLDDLPGAQSALDEMLDHLDLHAINDENWFIDVGLEIGKPDHVVTWFADGHELLLQNVLSQSSHQAVANLMKSKKFKTDHMALLKDCAGFRAEMTVRIQDNDHVNYICAYCTEKNVHYQRHPGLYRYRRADELQIPEKHKKIIDDLNTMSETLVECSSTQGTLQTGSARLEVRVPLHRAITANRFFDERLLELTVVSIPAKTWW
ncbi:hypothetical protein EV401DRAFT_1863161 [Pisolithus croceorrhizus]|nr:hypothetical protein EV401DRAFT_1863161 [Pisolithus croceorrhizus]